MIRGVNERLVRVAGGLSGHVRVHLVCECVDERCFAVVAITRDEWEAITADPEYSLVRPGHMTDEQAVVLTDRYAVVRQLRASEGDPEERIATC